MVLFFKDRTKSIKVSISDLVVAIPKEILVAPRIF
jgi:hypothetical protein